MVSLLQLQDMGNLQQDSANPKWVTVSRKQATASHRWVTVSRKRATDNLCRGMDSLCKVMDSRFRDMDSLCLANNNNLCKGTECRPRCNSNGACLNNRTSMENHLASEQKVKRSRFCREQARPTDRDTKRLIEEESKKWRRGLGS